MGTTTINVNATLDGLSNVDSSGKETGDILKWNETSEKWESVAPTGGGGGRFGISNQDGEFTFYDKLQDAIDGATAGDTIQVFADYIENDDITITLKNGVNINGNGYSYTHNSSSNNHTFNNPNSSFVKLFNYRVNRVNGGTNSFIIFMENSSNGMDLGNSILKSDNGRGVRWTGQLKNGRIEAERNAIQSHFANVGGFDTVENIYAKSNIGIAFISYGNPNNCTFISVSSTAYQPISSNARAIKCFILSLGGLGADLTVGKRLLDCVVISTASDAVKTSGASFTKNCYLLSTAGSAFVRSGGSGFPELINSTCISSSSASVSIAYNGTIKKCYIESLANFGVQMSNASFLDDCTIVVKHDNPNSHGVRIGTGSNPSQVLGCNIKVENEDAFCISSNGLRDAFVVNNICQGATVAIDPNITNLQTNTPDSAGNILIG